MPRVPPKMDEVNVEKDAVMLTPTNIVNEVRRVLAGAHSSPKYGRTFLTAHQILAKLSDATRQQIVLERGVGGIHSGRSYTAASLIADAAQLIPDVEMKALHGCELSVDVDGTPVKPGNENIAIYRLCDQPGGAG